MKQEKNSDSKNMLDFQSKCDTIFKVSATIFFNVNATGVSVKVGTTPSCI
jgi:hypothetical protein